ncbi:MAG: VanZ family protein [Lachnospiraceae bacterium]|nr:VanZ family protein [Lachnospiraceae bacterium]
MTKENNRKYKTIRIILTIFTVLTVAVIWGHSVMPRSASTQESVFFKDMVDDFLHAMSGNTLLEISEALLRKSAHFIEYAVLGFELSLLFVLYGLKNDDNKKAKALFTGHIMQLFIVSVLVAMIDETIQYFSGRYSSLFDVWLDLTGVTFATIVFFIIVSIKAKKRKRQPKVKRR